MPTQPVQQLLYLRIFGRSKPEGGGGGGGWSAPSVASRLPSLACHQTSDVSMSSDIRVSDIEHASDLGYQTSDFGHMKSDIGHRLSDNGHQTSGYGRRTSNITDEMSSCPTALCSQPPGSKWVRPYVLARYSNLSERQSHMFEITFHKLSSKLRLKPPSRKKKYYACSISTATGLRCL